METKKTTVEMTAQEAEEFAVFKAAQAKERAKREKQEQQETYKKLVDETVANALHSIEELSGKMTQIKKQLFADFETVISLKNELYSGQKWLREDRITNSFTNQEGTKRVTIGYHTNDNYLDTYTEGVKMVEEYIASLATDENSMRLADMVRMLLRERGKSGQLKAQNVLRLQQMANESQNETFIEGIRVIMDAYSPIKTKRFIKVEKKGDNNEWIAIPTSITECNWEV